MPPRQKPQSKSVTVSAVRPGIRSDELIDAAARVFSTNGYGQTSIQQIADEVGLLKSSLYHYIDTKEDLLFEVIRSRMVISRDLVKSIRNSKDSTLDRLRAYVQSNIEGSLNLREHTAVFVHDFRALSSERQQFIVDLRREHDLLLRDLIEDAKREGLATQTIDVQLVALAILSMSGSLYRWYNPAGKLSAKSVAQELTRFVLHGLGIFEA